MFIRGIRDNYNVRGNIWTGEFVRNTLKKSIKLTRLFDEIVLVAHTGFEENPQLIHTHKKLRIFFKLRMCNKDNLIKQPGKFHGFLLSISYKFPGPNITPYIVSNSPYKHCILMVL